MATSNDKRPIDVYYYLINIIMKIYLVKSKDPDWMFEVYDWNHMFRGYMGYLKNNNLSTTTTKQLQQ